ncbi:MAG: DUF4810 domain-containing protein [Thalassotalea sp.]
MMKVLPFKLIAGVCIVLLSGCASNNTQYHWGQYESLVYKGHIKPEEVSAIVQIDILETDIEQAKAENKPVPPGVYAHLGLMYAASGQKDLALSSLAKEKELFPESTVFINGLIERASANK